MRKRTGIICVIYMVLCVLVTCWRATGYTEQIRTEKYGVATDETVALNAGGCIASEFEATGDALSGVHVKFQSEEAFGEEIVRAKLIDCATEEMLAQDTAILKNERIQNKDGGSSIYFEFCAKGVKDRRMRLELTLEGEDVRVQPFFVVSKSSVATSQLTVDGEREDLALVFSVRYSEGMARNIGEAAADGILWLLAGGLFFFYLFTKEDKRMAAGHGKGVAVRGKGLAVRGKRFPAPGSAGRSGAFAAFLRRHGKLFGYFAMLGGLFLAALYVYKFSVSPVVYKEHVYFLKKMYVVLCVLLSCAATVFYAGCIVRRLPLEKLFVPAAIALGIIFSLVIALDTVPDEPSHIDTAYAVSNELLGVAESEKPGYIYKRACDVDAMAEEWQSLSVDSYKRLYQELFTTADDETLVECAVRSNLNNAGRIYYLPQALGITAGRLLGLGMMPTMMLGRLFSLLCYVLITYFALKKLPVAKTSLFLIGILPITLQQAASMSYDGMINAVAFLYVSYCLYAMYGKREPGGREMLVLVITGCMMASVKGGVYVALGFLPLAAALTRKNARCAFRWSMAAASGVMLFAFAGKRFFSILGRFAAAQGSAAGGAASTEIYTFGYVVRHPLRFIGMFIHTFYKQGDAYLRNLLGGNLGWREVNINWTVIFCFLLLLLLSCIVTGREKRIGMREKVCFGGISFAAFFCVEVSMLLVWTPVTYQYITGVQGRYFLPFFLLILLMLRGSFVSLKRNIDYGIVFAAGVLDIVTVLQVVQKVMG